VCVREREVQGGREGKKESQREEVHIYVQIHIRYAEYPCNIHYYFLTRLDHF